VLFYEFLNVFGGTLISIDIDPAHLEACGRMLETVQPRTGKATFVPMAGDSIGILKALPDQADFIYLDSYDLERNNPVPSMQHHLAELRATKGIIVRSGDLLLAVDDNFKPLGIGKGQYVLEWAQQTHQNILIDDYQLVMHLTGDSVASL
jgi:hypothetical protein